MTESALDYEFPVMHSKYRFWHRENDGWKKDVASWQQEMNRASLQLRRFEDAAQEAIRALAEHFVAKDGNENTLREHEESMRAFECGRCDVAAQGAFRNRHREQARVRIAQREKHEQFTRRIHRFMSRLDALTVEF